MLHAFLVGLVIVPGIYLILVNLAERLAPPPPPPPLPRTRHPGGWSHPMGPVDTIEPR
jgi:hypothetical protein